MRIILASSSPRRKELIESLGIDFEIITKDTKEELDEKKNHYEECMNTAYLKAKNVFDSIEGDVIVIGGDTIVSYKGKIYGKPKNREDAFNMLKSFSGHSHEVISSVCFLVRKKNQVYQELTYDTGKILIDKMDDKEINDWIDSNNVYNKAGGYAIQEGFGKYVKKVTGDYFSIVGFPLNKVYNLLKKYI